MTSRGQYFVDELLAYKFGEFSCSSTHLNRISECKATLNGTTYFDRDHVMTASIVLPVARILVGFGGRIFMVLVDFRLSYLHRPDNGDTKPRYEVFSTFKGHSH